jgi:hypothetical protein
VRRERWLNQMIMEQQPDVSGGPAAPASVPVVSSRRDLSSEVRASLEAVRLAGVAARARARRQTLQARIALATMLVGLTVFAFAFAPRLTREIRSRRHAQKPAAAVSVAVVTAKAATLPETAAPPAVASAPAAPVTAAADSPTVAAPNPVAPTDNKGCDTGLIRRAPWRLSAQACVRAFDLDPSNGRLALAIAHAEQAHGSPEESARWAQRALELNPGAAEAYVLIARAAARRGHHDEARAAYRRYLDLAPRGWHQAEARAAQIAAPSP